ncbi:MAG: fatty acid desaturase [Burkholderiales bacterium]
MRKLFVNGQYFITPLLILATTLGIVKGGAWVWLGYWVLLAAIVMDALIRTQTAGAGVDANGKPLGIPGVLNSMMYAMLPVFILLQIALAWRVYQYAAGVPIGEVELLGIRVQDGITGWQLAGATLATGIWQGMGIIFGHELAHTKGFSFVIARWIMALSGSAHFCFAHVYNHHLELGDAVDPATSPRGRSLYAHLLYSHFGQSMFSKQMEETRLAKRGKDFWSWDNRWLRGYAMSLPSVALFAFAGGWVGVGILFVVWVISNFELEALNYMEHYGLIRAPGQSIEYRHSWDSSTALTSVAFIEIGRQADHHDRGETHFWELADVGAPNPGIGYFAEFALALVPPLFHKVMKPKLADWDRNFATPEERALANRINQKVGYLVS